MNTQHKRIQSIYAASLSLLLGLSLLLVVSCGDKKPAAKPTMGEKIENKIDDALDRRPGEPALVNPPWMPLRTRPKTPRK